MICICGHSEDDHIDIDGNFEEVVLGECMECDCICRKFEEVDLEGTER
jgi:hypothetical protein